ncbi:unnamed protein product [Urochloa humidicola]
MAAADAAGAAVISQMPVEPPPIVAGVVAEPPPVAAEAVAEPPSIAAGAVVAPPPKAADAVVPSPSISVEAVGAPPPAAADDAEAAAEPVPVVPPPPPPPPPEQKIQSVMDGIEEPLPGEIHKIIESIEVQHPSHADDQKPCDMVTGMKEYEANHCSLVLPSSDSEFYPKKQPEETVQPSTHLLVEEQLAMVIFDNNSKESEKQVPTQPCPSSLQQISMDTDDLSDDSPTRNSNDDSDHSDGGHYYDRINRIHDPNYRFFRRRERMMCEYLGIPTRRNCWRGDYPYIPDLVNPYNPMGYRDTEPWNCWPSSEPDYGKKRYNTSADTGCVSHWSSPEPDYGKNRYSVGAGLSNPHWWTCFLNCILQCMVHTVPLVLKLREADHPDPCPRASIGFCCFCSLKLHAKDSIRLSGGAFYPESFVNQLKSISSKFESGVQQDAQEFFSDLLEKLDEASVSPRSSLEEPSSTEEGGIAKKIFGGCLKSQLHCPECNRCSDKSEPFIDLSLEITMMESLMDALQSFTKVELIEDFMCDGCKSRVNMEKHFEVEQAPEVLVIHLKRFTNFGGKISDKVKYPLELDINSFMCSSDDTPQKYDLYGVVVHHGMYGRGHYVCYIRSSVDDWYEFIDDKIRRFSEASVLDSAAYLLFYVKQGSSPWFSTLLEKEDKCPQDGSVSLAEQGTSEIALINIKDEESTSSQGKDHSGYCLVGPAEENGNGPNLLDFSQDIQQNGNANTLSDEAHKLAEGSLGGISGGTQELGCLTGSSDKNGHADGFLEPWEKEDISQRGSLYTNEMDPSTHGSSEVDTAVTQGCSPLKSENICSLLQLSPKYDDKPGEKEDVRPRVSLDTSEMNPSTHGSSEVDPAVTQGGGSPSEKTCSLLQLSHKHDKPWQKEDVSPRGSLDTSEMNPSTHGSSEVDPAATQGGGSPPKSEKPCSLLQLSHKDDKPWEKEDVSPRGSLDTKEMNPSTNGSLEVDLATIGGVSAPKSENICSLLSHRYDDNIHRKNFSSQDETGGCSGAPSMGMCTSENETVESKSNHEFGDSTDGASKGCCEVGSGGCKSEKRKRPSSADADGGGGGGESKASTKRRRKHLAVARYFHLCRRRAWVAATGESTE